MTETQIKADNVALDEEVYRKVHRAEMAKGVVIFLLVGFALAVLSLLAYNSVNNHKILTKFVDCTQPPGVCYSRGQKTTGDAIQTIEQYNKNVVVDSIICAKAFPTPIPEADVPKIIACVNQRLTQGK